jgi:hypothetical protein
MRTKKNKTIPGGGCQNNLANPPATALVVATATAVTVARAEEESSDVRGRSDSCLLANCILETKSAVCRLI